MGKLFKGTGKVAELIKKRQQGSKAYTGIDPAMGKPKQNAANQPAVRPLGAVRTPLSPR
jgi:hypothetical protein